MDSRYNPQSIEEKWQQTWAEQNLDQMPEDTEKPKFYALSMFPYPSGSLHMGHVRNYTIIDVIARLKRMQGYRVLNPMGWDAFGLPAENAAIERGIPPAEWTYQNISQMKGLFRRLGISFDWTKEVTTCSPDYYRWTQWLFLQFLEAGLAYQKEAAVNWDPIDQTVLANEQVDNEGRSWRSGAKVERKLLRQWFLKITDYAEQLLNDLDKLPDWPERVKLMQANWIGKSVGAYLEFPIVGMDEKVAVFTTRPDTIYGVSYVVLAPEHPLTQLVTTADQKAAVDTFIKEVALQSEMDRTADDKPKRGIPTGGKVINPFNDEEIPIWIADYVLYEYGTGAVMGVPAHDTRDFKFANQYELPIKVVIVDDDEVPLTEAYTEPGIMINSESFNGMDSIKGKAAIIQAAVNSGCGKARVQYRLRDWLISRQRYWGAPIPVIHCPTCGTVPVPQSDLPVLLPENVQFTGKGSPLAKMPEWVNVPCPSCGTPAQREMDTMDTFMDSSWYFLRYPDAQNQAQVFDSAKTNDWMPVDQYVGGIEHAILHLLYSRFFTKVLRDRGLIDCDEPFKRLLTQGMVQAKAYKNPVTGKYVSASDVDPENPKDPQTGEVLEVFYEKMSKSKYNGVDPLEVMGKYGVDTARMFILFKAPPEKDLEWDDADVEGQFRFLNRVWRVVTEFASPPPAPPCQGGEKDNLPSAIPSQGGEKELLSKAEKDLRRAIHTAIKEVREDLEGEYQFNTAVSEMMKLNNALADAKCKDSPVYAEGINTLILLLAPFSPHIADELWHLIGNSESVHLQTWPVADPSALVTDEITLVIQVMGKTRGTIQVPSGADKAALENYARESDLAKRHLEGKEIKKVIVVPGKLVNFVVAG
ncbi:leucine--tRNA ligase [Microcoleus sp. PH2017_28_MFU_U_A]|uniref:leucine--tRNA ligase n=1 Tax=Microcoleus sp. PH2017_28_MFU_U_A TaxID=2798838 RepID=UPI001D94380F|nr:leucine--tRNA ligase [Microcoleus sp. PH2017_28_MFU_U_A]MCC3594077.1 leucine--tRNA ligase [Microcoleus sp. PH2017_28_MFU_U_A]